YDVEIDGDTPNPNLRLGRIPDTRNVTDSSFTARWRGDNKLGLVSYMNARQQYFETLAGVEIMPSVSQYQMTMRTVKYAMLIIVLTFVAFMLVELWRQKSVNPLQYVLIGLALVLFYTLLLSFSEYMNFSYAYLIAAVMTGGLSTAYTASVFRDWRTAVILALILASLYLYIYILTQIESYSLLAGSIGLFVILAVVMFSSQKIFNKQG
ncbi:MAG: cell envelope integrity protein CreD, partial [Rikenellaceae bacterium]|nr:cell envelope integrity protein CreD [Rikenellaceae bacterium]